VCRVADVPTPDESRYRTIENLRVRGAINPLLSDLCIIEQTFGTVLMHFAGMKRKDLTPQQLSAVACPTCGVAVGELCQLHSGAPRSEPHLDRKLAAIEAVERKSR
jgi:hypothetical protein